MKLRLFAACLLSILFAACGKSGNGSEPEKPSGGFTSTTYNGEFVIAIGKAYEEFEKTDELPQNINVQGINYSKVKYFTASCILLQKIQDEPDSWQKEDIELPKLGYSAEDKWNTFYPDEISMEEVRFLCDNMYSYAEKNNSFPIFCTFPTKYTESDGTEHDNKMTANNAAVVLARVFNQFCKNGTLPEKVSSWQSDFLRKTSNCDTESQIVLAARDEALSKAGNPESERAKAEALFNYSRDEWEWLDYSNTRRGSVEVVKQKGGNCCDLSHALIAMCRASGIRARYMHGQCQYSSGVIGHVFVEIFVDGQWFICDPSNNSNTFGHHNWTHMATFNGQYKTLPF